MLGLAGGTINLVATVGVPLRLETEWSVSVLAIETFLGGELVELGKKSTEEMLRHAAAGCGCALENLRHEEKESDDPYVRTFKTTAELRGGAPNER